MKNSTLLSLLLITSTTIVQATDLPSEEIQEAEAPLQFDRKDEGKMMNFFDIVFIVIIAMVGLLILGLIIYVCKKPKNDNYSKSLGMIYNNDQMSLLEGSLDSDPKN